MGGDALTIPAKRLTNEEFKEVVREVLERVAKLCRRIQVYPPMPEKVSHGDVDFLIILEEGRQAKEIVSLLECKEHVEDKHGKTMNCEFKGYQVDFKMTESDEDFEMAIFYKSFSGVGSFFGYLTHSETVSLSEKGLFAIRFITPTIKHKHLVTNKPNEVLEFYGVDPKKFALGFERRQQLFRYLLSSRFFDFDRLVKDESKNPSKLMAQLREFCLTLPEGDLLQTKKRIEAEDICELMLSEFKQKQQFDKDIEQIHYRLARTRQVKDKFNGKHIMELFGTPKNKLNEQKTLFRGSFKTEEEYEDFILGNSVEEIAIYFRKVALHE